MSRTYPWARRLGGSGLMAAVLAVLASSGLAASPASASVPVYRRVRKPVPMAGA